jgi:hypothetical protein
MEDSNQKVLDHDEPKGAVAVVQGDEYVPMHQPGKMAPKQSHACCGCCCDTRRAVIVVNLISLVFASLAILSIAMITSDQYAAQIDDDAMLAALDEMDGAKVGMTIGFASLGIMCNTLGIYGATRFSQWAVMIAGSWYVVELVRSLVYLDFGGAIMSGFFAYPHVIFWQEMRNGVMTSMTYSEEEQCCTCC